MRLPKITELTEEQKKVYLYAPNDKHVLVQGPPGTGKTLIACLRAIELQKRKTPVVLGMFNRVLMRYSANVGEGQKQTMPSETLLAWFRNWWPRSGLPPHPDADRIVLEVKYEDREAAKGAGATWHPKVWQPWGRRPGVWAVDSEKWSKSPQAFSRWKPWHSPPCVDGNENVVDWTAVSEHMLAHDDKLSSDALNIGTLLIDEGQDFPEGFYKFLRQVSALAAAPGRKIAFPLRCFVLADENQQLTEQNSTLEQIAGALKIDEKNRYVLLDNFRNSREIAELARSFFADVGVLPRLPSRSTQKPEYLTVSNLAAIVREIKTWLVTNPEKEVGVLTFSDSKRAALFEALKAGLAGLRGRNITVQTYSWSSRKENRVDELLFDAPDVVTVLNMQSCKGLEFDAAYIVDLHEAPIGLYGPDRFKMQLFVGVSRARDWVHMIDSGSNAGRGEYVKHLPGEQFLLRDAAHGSERGSGRHEHAPRKQTDHVAVEEKPSPRKVSGKGIHASPDNWEHAAGAIARTHHLKINDKRSKGGAFWINGGKNLGTELEALGFRYAAKQDGWWRK